MKTEEEQEESIGKFKELINDIEFAMLTTIDGNYLRSRPMATQEYDNEGALWFFTSDQTHKNDEIEQDNRVNIAYAKPEDNIYVSVSGRAEVVKDKAKIKQLWKPLLKAWFPEGLDDPTLTLLKVSIEKAEYWDTASSTIVQLGGFIKSWVTGERASGGEHKQINLN
jgi:general stress protein 26